MKRGKKYLSMLIVIVMFIGGFGEIAYAMGEDGPERLLFSNQYISFSVNTKNGRFSSRTTEGDPSRTTDSDEPILYEKDIPETSYTSFVIDEEEVIFGNTYGSILNRYGYFLQPPEVSGNISTAVWKYKDLEITQYIELLETSGDISVGNAQISYAVKNTSGQEVIMGSRILLDVMTGSNDGPLIMKSGDMAPIQGERQLKGDDIPLFWNTVDDLENPRVTSYGTLYGWGDAKPSKVIFGHWQGMSSAKWDYDYDMWLEYSLDNNKYGAADSAVGIYWENQTIPAGEVRTFTTMLGMGDLERRQFKWNSGLAVNVSSPKKVLLDEENPVPFEISVELDNTFEDSYDMYNYRLEISYPDNCQLIDGSKSMILPVIEENGKLLVNWTFLPRYLEDVNVYDFEVSFYHPNNAKSIWVEKTVYVVAMPSFTETPDIQYSYITPNNMYIDDKYRVIQVKGDNLNYLRDDPDQWYVYLKDKYDVEYPIGADYVSVTDDSTLYITIPDTFDVGNGPTTLYRGQYGLGLKHNLSEGFYRDKALTITTDVAYMRRGYGTLLITNKETTAYGDGNEEFTINTNSIHHFKGEQEVVVPSGEKEVMRIRGDIQRISEEGDSPKYSVIPDKHNPTHIGDKLLRIEGADDETDENGGNKGQPAQMIVDLKPQTVVDSAGFEVGINKSAYISGNDKCRIYMNVQEKVGALVTRSSLIWSKAFELSANDLIFENPRMFGLSHEVSATLGTFTLGIKEFKVHYVPEKQQYAADFSGMLDLLSLLEQIYTYFGDGQRKLAFLDIQVDNFRVYEDGTIDFKIDTGIGLPPFTVQHFNPIENPEDMKGLLSGRLKIDTIEDLFSISAKLGIPAFQEIGGDLDDTGNSASVRGTFGVFAVDTPIIPLLFVDTLEFEIDTSGGFIPLGNIPLAINQIGGGIYDLHTIRDAFNNGEAPDIKADFWFGINDTFSPLIFGNHLFNFKNTKISVGNRRIRLSGDIFLYSLKMFNSGTTLYSYPVIGADIWGEINILDAFIGRAEAEITYDFEKGRFFAGGELRGTLQVPPVIPVFGGYKFIDTGGVLSTDGALVFFNIGKTRYGVKYSWFDQEVSLASGDNRSKHSLVVASTGTETGLYTIEKEAEDGTLQQMTFGTNVYAIPASTSGGKMRLLGTMDAGGSSLEFDSTGSGALLVQGKYQKGQDIMPIEIYKPDGTKYEVYTEGELQNAFTFDPDVSESEMSIAIDIPVEENMAGTWTVRSPAQVDFSIYGVKTAPEIDSINVTAGEDGQYDAVVAFTGQALETTDTIDLYVINREAGKETAICLLKDQPVSGNSLTHSFTLPDNAPTGSYSVAAVLNHYDLDGSGGKNLILSDRKESEDFSVTNEKTPQSPQNIVITPMGSRARVEWDAVTGQDISGYLVSATDGTGTAAEGSSSIYIEHAAGKDRYETFIEGWTTEREYDVVVQAFYKEEKPKDDTESLLYSNIWEQHGSSRYQVDWEQDTTASEYEVFIYDKNEQLVQTFLYAAPENIAEDEMVSVVVRGLDPAVDYTSKVFPIREDDLVAKNVTCQDIGDGSSKTITWDAVSADNIKSYTIAATPQEIAGEDSDLVLYEYILPDGEQPGTYTVVVEGFDNTRAYDVAVVANKRVEEASKIYYGELSTPQRIYIGAPQPPEFEIVLEPDESRTIGDTVAEVYHENSILTYITNTDAIKLSFKSDSAVSSTIFINNTGINAEGDKKQADGAIWNMPIALNSGQNEIRVRAYNENGEWKEQIYKVLSKTTLPAIWMNETVVEDGIATISGMTELDAEITINGVPMETDDEGRFNYNLPLSNKVFVDVEVVAKDFFGNENKYCEQIMNSVTGEISGVIIEAEEFMTEGREQKLKLFAIDGNGARFELPDEYVSWSLASDNENALIEDGMLKALKAGQCVVAAEFQVNDGFAFKDMLVIDIHMAPMESFVVTNAYLDEILLEGISEYRLNPLFSKDINEYSLGVPKDTGTLTITPKTDLENASIQVKINDIPVEGEPIHSFENPGEDSFVQNPKTSLEDDFMPAAIYETAVNGTLKFTIQLPEEDQSVITIQVEAAGKLPAIYTFNVNKGVPFVRAMAVDSAGTKLSIAFSEVMADPTGKHDSFTVTADSQPVSVIEAVYNSTNIIDLMIGQVYLGQTVKVAYQGAAGEITSSEGKVLEDFGSDAYPVTNQSTVNHPEQPVTDENMVAGAKAVLAQTALIAVEGVDTNIIPKAQSVVDAVYSGVMLTMVSSANTQIASPGGAITYGESTVTGDVTFKLTKNAAAVTQAVSVTVPARRVCDVISATISPAQASFDKNPLKSADVHTAIQWNDATWVNSVRKGNVTVGEAVYAVNADTLTIKKDYLVTQPTGIFVLEVDFDKGNPASLTIDISDTTPPSKSDPPTWPKNSALRASATTKTKTTLRWTEAEDDMGVTGYKVYQDSSLVQTVAGSVYSCQVTGLSPNTAYAFMVQAGDADNNWTDGPTVTVHTDPSDESDDNDDDDNDNDDEDDNDNDNDDNDNGNGNNEHDNDTGNNGSSGNGTGGGSTPPEATPTPTPGPSSAAQLLDPNGNIIESISPILDYITGTASVELNSAFLTSIFDTMTNDDKGAKTIVIDIPETDGAKAYEAILPVDFLTAGDASKKIEMKTNMGTVTVSGNTLHAANTVGAQTVSLAIAAGDKSKLHADVRAQIGDRPLIEINLKVDGKPTTWNNEAAPVTITVPYTPTDEELKDPEHITVWYIDGSGKVVPVPNGRYDPATGEVTFTTTHFSQFAIVTVHKTFNDLDNVVWAKKPIQVMASKGIINGTSKDTYSPTDRITRADYLVLLVRTLELHTEFESNFDDVQPGTYYYEAVGIAKKLGITTGVGNHCFNPKENISRQDMMVLTTRALQKFRGLVLSGHNDALVDQVGLDKFTDTTDIAGYALESMETLVKEGLIKGTGDKLNPRDHTTRAEAAVFLYRIYNQYR